MRPFADISYGAQVKRLKRLAQVALLNYDLGEMQLVRLGHGENTTFRVEEVALSVHQSDKCLSSKTQWYVLRIHRPSNHSLAAIRSELLWLSTLRRDTDLVVPEPVPSKDGSLFTVVETEGVPQPRCCVLFRWIPGRFLNAGLSPLALGRVGTLMARLHQHAQQFTLPEGFVRPRLDGEGQFSRCALQLPDAVQALFPTPELEILDVTAQQVRAVMLALGHETEVFGLIHADLHHWNYLFHKGEVRVIDFDDCGFGYYLYDMATTLWPLRNRPDLPALRQAFLKGYRLHHPLSKEHELYLDTFFAARRLFLARGIVERLDNPKLREKVPNYLADSVRELKSFLGR